MKNGLMNFLHPILDASDSESAAIGMILNIGSCMNLQQKTLSSFQHQLQNLTQIPLLKFVQLL